MTSDIEKYFKLSVWRCEKTLFFTPGLFLHARKRTTDYSGDKKDGKKYLSIIKSILKDMEIKLVAVNQKLKNSKKVRINTTLYTLEYKSD